jgi:uncharacterized damage-inducible protein DinB
VTFRSPIERVDAPLVADERRALGAWLDYQRATLLWKLEGLDDEQLRRPMVPSGLTLLGLVKHLTDVEHGWFARSFAQTGEPSLFYDANDRDADFHVREDETTEAIVSGYVKACERSRDIVARAASLDETFLEPRLSPTDIHAIDLRWVLIHMIEETARHNGHADIIRELIDGSTGD